MRTGWRQSIVVGLAVTVGPLTAAAEDIRPYPMPPLNPSFQQTPNQPQAQPPLLNQLAQTYSTPKAVAKFLSQDFTFQRDEELFGEEDHWQAPEEFAVRKTGDCEDYALLASALLRRNGVDSFVFSILGEEGYAHTVAVFVDEKGRYDVINQGELRNYRAKSLEALASAINPGWTFAAIGELEGTRGRIVRALHNDRPAVAWDDPPTLEF